MHETETRTRLQAQAQIDAEDFDALQQTLLTMQTADITELMQQVHPSKLKRIFLLLPEKARPDLLAELEGSIEEELLKDLSTSTLSNIVEHMAPDDAADVLGDLPDQQSEAVLQLMRDKASANEFRTLLGYPEDSAGGIMTTDFVAMQADSTVEAALNAIADLEASERFFAAHVIEPDGTLIGIVDVWELLRQKNKKRTLGEIAERDFRAAIITSDQEDVAYLLAKYDLDAIPITDADGKLVGRVTSDDVIDVMKEEASEDIFRLAGSDDEELEHSSVLRSCRTRLPWLLITLFGGTINAVILNSYSAHLESVSLLVLASFIPTVLAMGGNAGIQSSILVVRSLAVRAEPTRGLGRLIAHEVATGASMGMVCGTIIGFVGQRVVQPQSIANSPVTPLQIGTVVAVALFAAMTFAAAFGTLVPVGLNRLKIDPAVAAGPFITIANDIVALLIYFGITVLMLNLIAV